MEQWAPLLDIFLNFPCPESKASQWLHKSFDASTSSAPITTNSFLSLLSKPLVAVIVHSSSSRSGDSSPLRTKRIVWMQTLPNAVQSRILSFLSIEHRKFSTRQLTKLAKDVLVEAEGLDFWVKRSAQQLLDKVSQSNYEWVSCLNLDSEEQSVENEFDSLPDWLKDEASANSPVLPWLPITREQLNTKMPINSLEDDNIPMTEVEDSEKEHISENPIEVDVVNDRLDQEIEEKANLLKAQVLSFESSSKIVGLANEIRNLCLERGGDSMRILGLIEPWKADDETVSILISNISDKNEELGWPSHVLCSTILPKLLVLEDPASRVLTAAMIEYCMLHQKAAVYALLYPLIFREGGINKAICDVIIRVIKECLHTAHVSAFCQKILCGEEDERKFVCLPCHRCLISNKLVWNESLFSVFQNILNLNVHLPQDSVSQLVIRISESSEGFSKSLKFGNFLLCLVNKCAPLLKSHKVSLIEATQRTETLVTKSILSKLATL